MAVEAYVNGKNFSDYPVSNIGRLEEVILNGNSKESAETS